MTARLAEDASFFRAALLLGLLPGSTVVKWAEAAIDTLDNPPHPLLDIVSISPDDITGLRYTLLDLCDEALTEAVLSGILGLIFHDLESGNRSVVDTVMVLSQLRRFSRIDHSVYRQLLDLELRFDTAQQTGGVDAFGDELHEWLRHFYDTERKFIPQPVSPAQPEAPEYDDASLDRKSFPEEGFP